MNSINNTRTLIIGMQKYFSTSFYIDKNEFPEIHEIKDLHKQENFCNKNVCNL